jgi:two-component system, NarL family, sensor histidine kinase UhpB
MCQPRAIHAAMEGMVTIDEQMRIIMINPAAQRMFGRTPRDAIGMFLDELMPERFRVGHRAHVKGFFDGDETERHMGRANRLVGLRANGEEFPLEAVICKVELTTEAGPKPCATALLCDHSQEQALFHQIAKLNHQMRAIFETAPIAIWITDHERIAFANQACGKLFGVEPAESLVGERIRHLLNLQSVDSDFAWNHISATASEEIKKLVGKVTRPDGSEREVEIAVTRLPDQENKLVQMVIVDTTDQAREKRSLLASRRTLRELSAHIVEAREEERKRIARELHDELGQRLTALKIELSSLENGDKRGGMHGRLQPMIDMVDETVAATRRISLGLRPPMLDDLGLEAAIDWLINQFRDHNQVQVELRCETLQTPLQTGVAVALYRILQEALTNISRHAGAQRVQVEVSTREQWVQLSVQDDGQGFSCNSTSPRKDSFGLIGIRERVRMLGGQLLLKNNAKGGAGIVVRLPIDTRDRTHVRHAMEEVAPPPDTKPAPLTPWERP